MIASTVISRFYGSYEKKSMPVGYYIQPELDLLYFAGVGHCTGEEYREANLQAASDRSRRPGMHTIIDMQAVTELNVGPDQLQAIIASDRHLVQEGVYGDHFKTAIVIRGEVDELLGALYNTFVREENLGVQLFTSLGAAADWFGLTGRLGEIAALRAELVARLQG